MSNKKYTIHDMQNFATDKSGACLSEKYINSTSKLSWKCTEGHCWLASWNSVFSSHSWCPQCSSTFPKTLSDMQELADDKGGECLSSSYVNWKTKLQWKCANGHVWKAKPNSIQSGTWCPSCASGLSENKCRYVLASFLGHTFNKNRKILKGFELDGYCPELGLAFEYDGEQHYQSVPKFHRGFVNLKLQQERDKLKNEACHQNNIQLIRIPYYENTSDEALECFIRKSLLGFPLKQETVSWKKFYKNNSYLRELKEIARSHNGVLLSEKYMGVNVALDWQCSAGHSFSLKPGHIKNGYWCSFCSRHRVSLEMVQSLAKERQGECLSLNYVNAKTQMKWECLKGHIWSTTYDIVQSGSWCPICNTGGRNGTKS